MLDIQIFAHPDPTTSDDGRYLVLVHEWRDGLRHATWWETFSNVDEAYASAASYVSEQD